MSQMNTTGNTAFWLRKLVSPTGLMLVFILLFMPFVGAACGPIEVNISGWDMAVGGEPSVSTGGLQSLVPSGSGTSGTETGNGDVPVQPLMVITVFLVIAAIVLSLTLRATYTRALCGLIVAGLAAVSVSLNEAVVMGELIDEFASSNKLTQGDAAQIVGTRGGFWLTLVLLLAILAYNATELLLDRRQKARPVWPGYYGPPHDPSSGYGPGYGYPPPQSAWPPQANPYPQQRPPGQFPQ